MMELGLAAAGAGLNWWGAHQANETNKYLSKKRMKFQAQQNALAQVLSSD